MNDSTLDSTIATEVQRIHASLSKSRYRVKLKLIVDGDSLILLKRVNDKPEPVETISAGPLYDLVFHDDWFRKESLVQFDDLLKIEYMDDRDYSRMSVIISIP